MLHRAITPAGMGFLALVAAALPACNARVCDDACGIICERYDQCRKQLNVSGSFAVESCTTSCESKVEANYAAVSGADKTAFDDHCALAIDFVEDVDIEDTGDFECIAFLANEGFRGTAAAGAPDDLGKPSLGILDHKKYANLSENRCEAYVNLLCDRAKECGLDECTDSLRAQLATLLKDNVHEQDCEVALSVTYEVSCANVATQLAGPVAAVTKANAEPVVVDDGQAATATGQSAPATDPTASGAQ